MSGLYDELIAQQRPEYGARSSEHVERLEWPPARLAAEREQSLQRLLARAIERSPFHRDRLAGIDSSTMTEADLASLPIITDRRLTLQAVNDHIERLTPGGGPA